VFRREREIRSTKKAHTFEQFTFCAVIVKKGELVVIMLGIATAQNPMAELEANMEKIQQLKLKQKEPSPRSSPELDDSGLTMEVKTIKIL